MTGHELAKILLDMPDIPVRVHVTERGWSDDLDIEPDDVVLLTSADGTTNSIQVWPV